MKKNVNAAKPNLFGELLVWLRTFLKHFITPRLLGKIKDEHLVQNPYLVLTILYYGSLFFVSLLVLLLLLNLVLGSAYVLIRLLVGLAFLGYVVFGYWQLRRGRQRVASAVLLLLYGFIAGLAVVWWSISVPFGLLLFAFVIILSGITLGPRYTLPTAVIAILILFVTQLATEAGVITPDRTQLVLPPTLPDVINFGSVFLIIGLVSWLSGRQMVGSLSRALLAEAALKNRSKN